MVKMVYVFLKEMLEANQFLDVEDFWTRLIFLLEAMALDHQILAPNLLPLPKFSLTLVTTGMYQKG